MGVRLKRHNGIEWDDGGRWVDGNEADALLRSISNSLYASNKCIAELEAEVDDSQKMANSIIGDHNKWIAELEAERDDLRARLAAAKEWRGFICGVIHQHPEFSKPGAITELDKILSGDFQCPGCEDKSRRLEEAREAFKTLRIPGGGHVDGNWRGLELALAADDHGKGEEGKRV